jgi:ArsR family transcriptional regulator, virulence genes transcriptional regulator
MDLKLADLAEHQAEICRVFGNATRILILWVLEQREMSVGEIAVAIDSSLQNTSQHLRLMKDKGILVSRREGNAVYYRLQKHDLLEGCPLLTRHSPI